MQSRKYGKEYLPAGAVLAGLCAVALVMFVMVLIAVFCVAVYKMH